MVSNDKMVRHLHKEHARETGLFLNFFVLLRFQASRVSVELAFND
jgi:hypothetical protein